MAHRLCVRHHIPLGCSEICNHIQRIQVRRARRQNLQNPIARDCPEDICEREKLIITICDCSSGALDKSRADSLQTFVQYSSWSACRHSDVMSREL